MFEQSDLNYNFLQFIKLSEEENVNADQEDFIQSTVQAKTPSKVERLNRWVDSVDQ